MLLVVVFGTLLFVRIVLIIFYAKTDCADVLVLILFGFSEKYLKPFNSGHFLPICNVQKLLLRPVKHSAECDPQHQEHVIDICKHYGQHM